MGLGLENPLHIAIILIVVLLLFGARRLPEMGRGLGQGMREFKDGVTGRNLEQPLAAVSEEPAGQAPGAGQEHEHGSDTVGPWPTPPGKMEMARASLRTDEAARASAAARSSS